MPPISLALAAFAVLVALANALLPLLLAAGVPFPEAVALAPVPTAELSPVHSGVAITIGTTSARHVLCPASIVLWSETDQSLTRVTQSW
jgi:hypothetical protein